MTNPDAFSKLKEIILSSIKEMKEKMLSLEYIIIKKPHNNNERLP